jgi:hypothetical protein
MSFDNEFIKCCTQVLEVNFGLQSNVIIDEVKSKKNLNDTSNVSDFKEFIDLIEHEISTLLGKNKAIDICNILRNKAIELNISKQAIDICNALRTEPFELKITVVSGKNNALDVRTHITKPSSGQKYRSMVFDSFSIIFKKFHKTPNPPKNSVPQPNKPLEIIKKQESSEASINDKIEEFLTKNNLPLESEITRIATYLAMKFKGDTKRIKKDIIEKIKVHIKNEIVLKKIKKEINNFLTRYPQPSQTEIDEFVTYANIFRLNLRDEEIKHLIEKEKLHRKFSESQHIEEISELDNLINIIKTHNDRKDILKEIQKKELSYLVKDDSKISDKLLNELIELLTPIERKDTLEKPILKRKTRKVRSR